MKINSSKDLNFFLHLFVLLGAPAEAPSPLLSWDIVHEKMPWNILLLLGGGFALAHGSEVIQLIKSTFFEDNPSSKCLVADGHFPTLDKEIWTF